jgi:hypothetical protein
VASFSHALPVLGPRRVVGHLLAGHAAGADADAALRVLRRLEDALLDEALLAERLVGKVLPFALLVLTFLANKILIFMK